MNHALPMRSLTLSFILSAAAGLLSGTAATDAKAQNATRRSAANTEKTTPWPTKPVRIVVGFPGGSSPDLAARTLAEPLARILGQPVIVENRPGASGNIAADAVSKATDDHTLGLVINGNLTSAKILNPGLAFDPAKDFTYLSLLTTAPLVLVTTPNQPSGTDFFTAARSGADKWNYGSPGNGTVGHLGMEWLKSKTGGISAIHIPFPGNPQVVNALLGGQLQMSLLPPGIAMPQVRAGKLKAIGVTASGRSALVPELPSLSDAGLRDFNLEVWTALVGPAKLSASARARLIAEVPGIVREADTRQKLFNQGWQSVGTSPEGLQKRVASETAILGGIILARGIKSDQ